MRRTGEAPIGSLHGGPVSTRHTLAGRWMPLVATLGAASATLAAIWSVDDERFAPPPLDPGGWAAWASEREALDAVASISRLLITVAASYVLVVVAFHAVAILCRSELLLGVTSRISPAPLAAFVSLAVLGSQPVASAALHDDSDDTTRGSEPPVMVVLDEVDPTAGRDATPATPTSTPTTSEPGTNAPPTTPEVEGPAVTSAAGSLPSTAREGVGNNGGPAPGVVPHGIPYTVVEGDHLWGIAERCMRMLGHEQPGEAEIRTYWLALIEANTDRMVEPGNPDLLLPGQQLVLP